MLHRRFLLIFIGVFLFLSFAIPIEAATGIHEVINFQGKVVNSDGTNVTDGTYDFVIKLYDSAGSGGATLFTESWTSAALWSSTMSSAPASAGESLTYSSNTNESTIKAGQLLWNTTKQEVVTVETVNTTTNVITISPTRQAWAISDTVTNKIYVKDGVFIIPINALNADLSAVNFNTDNIYVGTNFNADGEMKPRIRFKTVPYAMNAAKVGGLTVTNTTGTFTLASGKTFTVNNTLTLQGTDSTTFTLPGTSDTLAGLASAQTLTNKTIGSTGLTFSGAATDIATASNEDFVIAPNGTGKVGLFSSASGGRFNVSNTGQSAIGKALGIFDQYESQDIFTASASGSTVFTVGRSNVTIADGKGIILGSTTNGIESTLTTNGAMYYSTSTSKFRCYQASAWTDCIGAGAGSGTVNSGISGFFSYYPSTGTTVDDQSVLYTDGTNIGIGTQSTTAKLTVSGTASISGSLTVGNGSAIQPAYGPLVFNYKSGANAWTAGLTIEDSTGKITLGSASNGFIFNPASGPSFAGNARPTKMITLTPEYSGAVLTAFYGAGTDTNITGSMTSDTDTSGNLLRNYYQWSSSQVALHYYTVAVRVRLPKDFAAWSTSNAVQVDFATQSTAAASNVVDVRIYNGDDTPGTIVASSTGNASGVASTWTTITIDDSAIDDGGAPDWDAADETAVIYIRMGSLSSNVVKIGDIRLSYLSSF